MMDSISVFADVWMPYFLVHCLEMSIFIGFIWLIDQKASLPVGVRYILWVLALIKVCVPPILAIPGSVTEAVVTVPLAVTAVKTTGLMIYTIKPDQFSLSFLSFVVWVVSILVMAAIVIINNVIIYTRLHYGQKTRIDRSELPAGFYPEGLQVFSIESLHTPMLIGFWNPRLYLPGDWQTWSSTQLRGIIAHELAHHTHRDLWVLTIQTVTLVLFALNPFVWLLYRKLSQVRELRCDEAAVKTAEINPIEYARLLHTSLVQQSRRIIPVTLGNHFMEDSGMIFSRVKHLLDLKDRDTSFQARHAVVISFAVLIFLPLSLQCSDQDPVGVRTIRGNDAPHLAVGEDADTAIVEVVQKDRQPEKVTVLRSPGAELETYPVKDARNVKMMVLKLITMLEYEGKKVELRADPSFGELPRLIKVPPGKRSLNWKDKVKVEELARQKFTPYNNTASPEELARQKFTPYNNTASPEDIKKLKLMLAKQDAQQKKQNSKVDVYTESSLEKANKTKKLPPVPPAIPN